MLRLCWLCCKKFRLSCFGFLDIKIIFLGHSEVTQPPTCSKFTQNSLVRLCSVCAGLCCKKFRLSCFGFLDIKIILGGHSEVTQPPTCSKFTQNSLVRLCSVCAGLCCKKFRLCCSGFLDIKIIFFRPFWGHLPPHAPNSPKIVSFVCAPFVLVCAVKSFVWAASVF